MNWKRIFRILITLLVLAGIAWAVYYFFYQNPVTSALVSSIFPSQTPTEQAASVSATLIPLTENPIFDYWINQQTNELFFLNPAGQIFKLSGNQEVSVNSQTLDRLNRIAPSAKGNYLLAEFNYPRQPIFSIFNVATNNWSPLPSGTIAAGWAPNADQVAYVDGRSLSIFTLSTNKTTVVLHLSQKELNLQWIADKTILLSTLPSSQVNTQTWVVDLNKGTIIASVDTPGSETQWAKDGSLGIKMSINNNQPQTSLVDANGSLLSQFTFVTLPEKCLIAQPQIYCAIPRNLPERVQLPDDYYKKVAYFDDLIYDIDLGKGSFAPLQVTPATQLDAAHLEIQGNKLLLQNRLDGKLYSLSLP